MMIGEQHRRPQECTGPIGAPGVRWLGGTEPARRADQPVRLADTLIKHLHVSTGAKNETPRTFSLMRSPPPMEGKARRAVRARAEAAQF